MNNLSNVRLWVDVVKKQKFKFEKKNNFVDR